LRTLKRFLLLAGLVGAVLAATTAAPASASTPCWKVLINDWLDGRIDQLYAVHCYRDAINHLPADIEEYSSARQDINRALQARLQNKPAPRNKHTIIGPAGNGGNGGPNSGNGRDGEGPLKNTHCAGHPSKADSVPLPIIVLAGIAGGLLLLGGAGFFARRLQARRVLRPAEGSSPPRNS